MNDYVMSVRAVSNGSFVAEPGPTAFLSVPDGQVPAPTHAIDADAWVRAVCEAATKGSSGKPPGGSILFFIHGYYMSEQSIIAFHRRLRDDLAALGFKGVLVSFDWPCGDNVLAYLADRHRAKISALSLVRDGILRLAAQQRPACPIGMHVLCHSTGAYVLREAFEDADNSRLPNSGWNVGQVIFAAGDVSSASLAATDPRSESIYRHAARLTNYFNLHDTALCVADVKRLGLAPRAGRVGLPAGKPGAAIDVDCSSYYAELTREGSGIVAQDQPGGFFGLASHVWFFGNRIFMRDVADVLAGTEPSVIPTRAVGPDGKLSLRHI